jgi:hypothetical protein
LIYQFHFLNYEYIRQMKSRKMGWAEHVARMGEERKLYRVLWESPREKDHWEGRDADGRCRVNPAGSG